MPKRQQIGLRLRRLGEAGRVVAEVEQFLDRMHTLDDTIRKVSRAIELMTPVTLISHTRVEFTVDPNEWDNIVVMVA